MKKAIYIFLSFISVASCQNKKTVSAIVDNTLKVGNGDDFDLSGSVYIFNKDFVVYEGKTHKIIYSDSTSFRIPKNDQYGFALDKNGIYLKGEFIKTDTTGFVVLGINSKKEILWKTKNAVFKDLTELKGIDAPTFTSLPSETFSHYSEESDYYKDKNFIYFFDKKIEGSDAATANKSYKEVCHDKNYIYSRGEIAVYNKEPYQFVNCHLYKTKKYVFYREQIIPYIDASTLLAISGNYAMDKNHVYYEDQIVPIKPENFDKIKTWKIRDDNYYITDGKSIYYGKSKIDREFDISSFGAFTSSKYCYDKNGVYERKYDKKLKDVIYEKLPFEYSDNVSSANTFTGSDQFVFYKNQAYETDTKTLYENLTRKQIELAQKLRFRLTNIEGSAKLKYNFDYQLYQIDNHIYFRNKLTDIDGNGFKSIDNRNTYYKNHKAVFYYTMEEGFHDISDIDVNSARIFNSFLIDKNYLYSGETKIINSQDIELLAIFPGYRSGCGLDRTPVSNFYLFKNKEGFWLVKTSDIISYRFLGKTFNRNWDTAFEEIELPKK